MTDSNDKKLDFHYETRCKRCAHVHIWHSTIADWQAFVIYCTEHTRFPFFCQCTKCDKRTFQDIVSYEKVEASGIQVFPKMPVLEMPERYNWVKPGAIVIFNTGIAFQVQRIDVENKKVHGGLYTQAEQKVWVHEITFTDLVEKLIAGEAWKSWIGPREANDNPAQADKQSWIFYAEMLPAEAGYYETMDSALVWRKMWWNGAIWKTEQVNGAVFSGFVSYWRPAIGG